VSSEARSFTSQTIDTPAHLLRHHVEDHGTGEGAFERADELVQIPTRFLRDGLHVPPEVAQEAPAGVRVEGREVTAQARGADPGELEA
jgi:hypothetical protein